jgi:anti-sigma regulatory factor (Ser/Thr protein kinase)
VIVHVHDQSQVAEARRTASHMAESLRFGDTAAGKAALVATELATNLIKHGGGGSILFDASHSLTVIAIDKGRGIASVPAAMSDGYSTAGSPGTGLGAMTRVAQTFDVYTLPGAGTAVLCRIDDKPPQAVRPPVAIGGVCTAKKGETVSGDAWTAFASREHATIAVLDGLGHGHLASTAATSGIQALRQHGEEPLERLMSEVHGALRPTRGAAVGLARVYPFQNRVDFNGIGNIAGGVVADGVTRRVVSMPGIAGHEMRKVNTFSYPWTAGSVLVLHSDGISAHWNAASYPGLMQHDPSLIAAVLYRDHCRGTDDATVVVAKGS